MAALTADQRHESPQAIPLLEAGLDRMWPDAVAGDKGVGATELRTWLQAPDIAAVIPYRAAHGGDHDSDQEAYRERPIIERMINRLKRYRRIATQHEKLASSYLAMVTIAMILKWLCDCRQTLADQRRMVR